eukprot:COSAG03_NODE_358_length_8602_cov_7.201694_3_plen_111_part_00
MMISVTTVHSLETEARLYGCPGISDAREIPQQLAQSCVPQEYRQTVLDTVEQTVRNLQGQLIQTVAQQNAELLALDRSHNVARTAYQEGLQSSQAARNAQRATRRRLACR